MKALFIENVIMLVPIFIGVARNVITSLIEGVCIYFRLRLRQVSSLIIPLLPSKGKIEYGK